MVLSDRTTNRLITQTTVKTSNEIDIKKAYRNLRTFYKDPTPLKKSEFLSEIARHDVFIKWETDLYTGAFKERGALNFLLSTLENLEIATESSLSALNTIKPNNLTFCAASAGNHALGLAYHTKRLGLRCVLVMPTNAPVTKIKFAEKLGAEIILEGNSFDEARELAMKIVNENGYVFVPAFDHPYIIAGQGTIGIEILEQLPDVDSVIVPVGGGGLLAGVAKALRENHSNANIIGVRSEWSVNGRKDPYAKQKPFSPGTIADGIAVKVPGTLTEPIMAELVDRFIAVSESEISTAMILLLEHERRIVEGSGAVGIIPILRQELPLKSKKTVVVVSGTNVDLNILSRLIAREMAGRSQMVKLLLTVPDRPGVLHSISAAFSKHQANVLQVDYDRSFSSSPGNVDVTFVIEVKDLQQRENVLKEIDELGFGISLLNKDNK